MRTGDKALRLTVYVGEADQYHHRPLYAEIVRRAKEAGLAGAAVVRGFEGFGGRHHIHTSRVLSLSEDLPVIVVVVDEPERIRAFVPQVEEIVEQGLAVLDEVEVAHASHRTAPQGRT